MRIKGMAWSGTKTENFDETVAFFRDVLDFKVHQGGPGFLNFQLPNGDLFEVLGPDVNPELKIGLKVDFLVDDVDETVKELEAKGVNIEGEVFHSDDQSWANFVAPDGNLYGFTNLFAHPVRQQFPDRVLFYGPHDQNGYLSNWYPAAIYLKGKIWPTAEHFYHSQKMAGTEYEEMCRRQSSASEAFELSRRPDIPVRKDWDQVKVDLMREAVTAKFSQNPDLGERLLATGEAILVENSPVDYFWGVGADWSGQNILGKMLMEVREKLKSE